MMYKNVKHIQARLRWLRRYKWRNFHKKLRFGFDQLAGRVRGYKKPADSVHSRLYRRVITISGVLMTVLWFGAIVTIYDISNVIRMDTNEFGDFLAGSVAPIAFFWFILGYLLQSHKLSHNTFALERQSEEIKVQNVNLAEQLRILTKNVDLVEIEVKIRQSQANMDSFYSIYNISREQMCLACASICRIFMDKERFFANMQEFGNGYKEIYCNSLKNYIEEAGKEAFVEQYNRMFKSYDPLLSFCERFENLMKLADLSDDSGLLRHNIEASGIGQHTLQFAERCHEHRILGLESTLMKSNLTD